MDVLLYVQYIFLPETKCLYVCPDSLCSFNQSPLPGFSIGWNRLLSETRIIDCIRYRNAGNGESLLNAGDRFKQYEAQQRIVSLVIESKDKMAVDFIIEFTMSAKSSGQMCLSMELLRDILVKRSPLSPDKLCQHHYLFLQFVGIVGYDHVTLVDFLTSPETNFREYLVKYLEHLKQTWKPFMDCVDHFKKHERDEFSETENDSGNKDYGMTASDDEYASSVSDIPQSTSFTSTESNTPCMNEDTNITSSCSKKAALLTSGVSVSTAAGLGLIAGAYDSSSEEGEDVTDDVTTLSDNDISDISSDTRADALGADSNTFVHKAYQEVGGFAEVDYCETDKSEKDQTKDKGVLKADNDTDTDIINEPTEILLDIDLSGDSVLANGLLDDVMGMLIRTRLSLERLHPHSLAFEIVDISDGDGCAALNPVSGGVCAVAHGAEALIDLVVSV
ncbi:hypothetical protein MAR_019563 [Mya arenaria]|uniref:Protein Lines N-terminal domain-containing protein n=1 Tax=Mya arenaria TaxID=6604 RepID=A0ABY7E4S7_MYAAR|nr:hypothetical protein MAR_019563 [Mya arenaria]